MGGTPRWDSRKGGTPKKTRMGGVPLVEIREKVGRQTKTRMGWGYPCLSRFQNKWDAKKNSGRGALRYNGKSLLKTRGSGNKFQKKWDAKQKRGWGEYPLSRFEKKWDAKKKRGWGRYRLSRFQKKWDAKKKRGWGGLKSPKKRGRILWRLPLIGSLHKMRPRKGRV